MASTEESVKASRPCARKKAQGRGTERHCLVAGSKHVIVGSDWACGRAGAREHVVLRSVNKNQADPPGAGVTTALPLIYADLLPDINNL